MIYPSDVERQDVPVGKAAHGQLVVADTREQVARINHVAHRVRVMTGEAADSVVTASGEQIGTGDTTPPARTTPRSASPTARCGP